ncbi:cytochrome c oxidase subunit 2A [Ornithinibacillus sp. 4-3]|uniref:Cytochrome c oxidase subunit 2A n=1 Tax=Ornithinibacillus sp. 4-3 TaxID=3231488 RepID=A0AB39HIJ8_9BACI
MAGPKVKEKESNVKKQVNHEEETSLKGTLASVMILGGIIVLSWIGVWMLFVTR